MANPNIFAAYLRPPKSVAEYTAEMDKGEADRLSLADARRTSAEKDRQIMEANAFRAALAGTDPTTPEGMNKLRSISPTAAMSLQEKIQNMSLAKAREGQAAAAAGKDTAQSQKFTYDLESAKRLEAIKEWTSAPTRQAAIDVVRRAVASGQISMDVATQALANMPATDAEWPAFAYKKRAELAPIDKQFELLRPKALPAVNTGGSMVTQLQDPRTGEISSGATLPRTVSPDEQLRAETSTNNARMQAGNRTPVAIQGPNGPMFVSPSDAIGQPPAIKQADKTLSPSAAGKLMENQQNLRRAQQALALIEGKNIDGATGDREATGWKGYVPNTLLQRIDPQGVDARAAIADLGSLVIHDRSGAAVTAAEFPRLKPFIPRETDDPEVVKKKLRRFVTEYENTVQEAVDFYKESGFKVPDNALRNAGGKAAKEKIPQVGEVRY